MRIALARSLAVGFAGIVAALAAPAAALAGAQPALVGAVSSSGAALSGVSSVAVSGRYAYSAAYYAGELTVIDIANPATPTVVASTQPTSPPLENGATVTIVGNFAFVASKNRNASKIVNDDGTGDSLTVVNIANPLSPQVLGSVHDPGRLFGAYGLAVSGHYAYVASQGVLVGQAPGPQTSTGSFSVIDLNNLAGGVVANIQDVETPSAKWARALEHATSVAVAGNYAYVTAFYSSQLTVINIANPLAPTIVASLGDSRLAYNGDVAVQGGYAYVADQTSGSADQLAVVSIANPAKPKIVSALSNPLLAGAYRIRVRGNFAEVSASDISAVTAIDISNPAAPRVAGSVSDPAHLNSTTGLDLDPSGRYVVAVSPELATEHPPSVPPYPLLGGPTVTGTISVIDLDPAPVAVGIDPASEPPNLTRRTSATFSFSTSDAVSTVRCGLDGTLGLCTSATSQQYGQLIPGVHSFSVAAIDAAGHTSSQRYQWTQYGAPRDVIRPQILGAASWGKRTSALRATVGLWTGYPAPAFSYRWMRCGTRGGHCRQIRGQTNTKHTIVASDIGSRLEFVAVARNKIGSSFAVSALTPVVSGTPAIKQVALTGLANLSPKLKLVIAAAQRAPLLKKLVLALPRGLSFATAGNAPASGVTILDSRRKRLRFRAAVVRGSLVITLRSVGSNVHAAVDQTALAVSPALATSVRNKRTKTVYLSVVVTDARNAVTRTRVRVRVS